MWLLGGTNSSGNGNVYSLAVNGASYTGLLAYRGFLNSIASGLRDYTVGLSGTMAYHFNRIIPRGLHVLDGLL